LSFKALRKSGEAKPFFTLNEPADYLNKGLFFGKINTIATLLAHVANPYILKEKVSCQDIVKSFNSKDSYKTINSFLADIGIYNTLITNIKHDSAALHLSLYILYIFLKKFEETATGGNPKSDLVRTNNDVVELITAFNQLLEIINNDNLPQFLSEKIGCSYTTKGGIYTLKHSDEAMFEEKINKIKNIDDLFDVLSAYKNSTIKKILSKYFTDQQSEIVNILAKLSAFDNDLLMANEIVQLLRSFCLPNDFNNLVALLRTKTVFEYNANTEMVVLSNNSSKKGQHTTSITVAQSPDDSIAPLANILLKTSMGRIYSFTQKDAIASILQDLNKKNVENFLWYVEIKIISPSQDNIEALIDCLQQSSKLKPLLQGITTNYESGNVAEYFNKLISMFYRYSPKNAVDFVKYIISFAPIAEQADWQIYLQKNGDRRDLIFYNSKKLIEDVTTDLNLADPEFYEILYPIPQQKNNIPIYLIPSLPLNVIDNPAPAQSVANVASQQEQLIPPITVQQPLPEQVQLFNAINDSVPAQPPVANVASQQEPLILPISVQQPLPEQVQPLNAIDNPAPGQSVANVIVREPVQPIVTNVSQPANVPSARGVIYAFFATIWHSIASLPGTMQRFISSLFH
jgi:hypothetical protein